VTLDLLNYAEVRSVASRCKGIDRKRSRRGLRGVGFDGDAVSFPIVLW
jgi:hypothetical protein